MANVKATIKKRTGTGWDEIRPKTEVAQIPDLDSVLPDTLNDLTDVAVSSPQNGQVLKYNGATWVNGADEGKTYSISAVDSGSNAIIRLSDSNSINDDITLVAGSNVTLTPTDENNITIAATDTNTWQANTNSQEGYVASGSGQANKVWKTDANGLPAWRADADTNTTYTAGTGLSLTGTVFANTAPDQTVALTGSGATTVTGTYPNFTISSTDNNTTYDLSPYALKASPALTGVPTAPTASSNVNNTQIATTAFVTNKLAGVAGGLNFAGSISLSTAKNGDNLAAAGLTSPGDYLIVTATGDITNAGSTFVTLAVQAPGDEGDSTIPVTLETGDWIVYVGGDGTTMTVSIINNTDTRFAPTVHTHTIANVTGLQTALNGKVAKAGDTMTGDLTLNGGGSARARILLVSSANQPNDIYFGSNGSNHWSLSSREAGDPFLGLYNASGSPGWAWQISNSTNVMDFLFNPTVNGNTVFHDGYHPNADKWTTARTLSLSGDASGSVSWDGSGNATLSVAVANDSHTHDGRYYTESEADSRFINTTDSYVSADTAGSTAYPRLVVNNSGASSPNWIRVSSNSEGILPYSNGNSYIGTSSWRFGQIHAVNFYESGTVLSSKYLGISAKAADSNLLDGIDSGSFLRSDTSDTVSPGRQISFYSYDTIDTGSGDQASLEVYQDTAGADAFMQFHIGGDYAAYFGLHGGINDFVVGGWSKGATYQRVYHDGYRPYADSAGRAYPKRVGNVDLNFNWSGQSGQPPWLWGGSDGSNMYVYNPSNFSVNYATSAGNADTVDGYNIVYGSTGTSTSTLYFVP